MSAENPAQFVENVSFSKTEASVLLDLLRGLAALLVIGEHWRNFLFVDYPMLMAHRALLLVPYLLTAAGHQAVVIFFVLSGYLISGSVFRAHTKGQWSWRSYMTHRLVRLWLVLLPGLVLCVVWDFVGIRLGHAPLTYAGHVNDHMLGNVRGAISPGIFAGDALFLQGIRVSTLGSDGALWSLANEFWYYVLFPLGLTVVLKKTGAMARAVAAALFVAVCWFVGRGILMSFPIWLIGAVLALTKAPSLPKGVRWAVGLVYAPLVFGLAKFHGLSGLMSDYFLAIATFGLLWVLLSAKRPADPEAAGVRFSRGLSRFSYTLYVAHMPFVLLLVSVAAGDTRWVPTAGHVLAGCGILLVALGYSYVLAWLTEFRTDAVRRWAERKLGISGKPAVSPHEAVLSR